MVILRTAKLTQVLIVSLALFTGGRSWAQAYQSEAPLVIDGIHYSVPIDQRTNRISFHGTTPVRTPLPTTQNQLLARARAWARSATTPAKRSEETAADGTTLIRAACTDLIQYELGGANVVHHLRYRVALAMRAGRYEFFLTDFLLEFKGTLQQSQAVYTPLEDVLFAEPADRVGIARLQAIRRGFQEFRQQITLFDETLNRPLN